LISIQWYVSVLTLRLAVYTLFGKARSNLGKHFLHPKKYALPYTYGCKPHDVFVVKIVSWKTYRNKDYGINLTQIDVVISEI